MYPAFSGMNSYPYQYYHPSWEPSQVKEEPSSTPPSSFMHGSFPQNYGYPFPPMQCPSCFHHTQPQPQYPPPYFNFRPPCPHFPSPPPPTSYGHFYGAPFYPVNYVPPPHYTTELPRYEYDKKDASSHCCGSSRHHLCRSRDDKHVKIEEHEPEVEIKRNESLVPVVGSNGFSQPVLWFPPGYAMSKKEPRRRVVEDEAEKQLVSPYYVRKPQLQQMEEQQESPRAKKTVKKPVQQKPSVKSVEEEPNVSYRWLPLDMNTIKELLEGGGDGKKSVKNVENKEQSSDNKQFPFPIFWMPYGGQGEEENVKKGDQKEEVSPGFKVIPMRFERPDTEPEKIMTAVGDDKSRASEKTTSTVKTIPVKPSEECVVPKEVRKDEVHKDAQKPAKIAEGNNGSGNGNGHSSSPKKSKLPPICLRVDPPKKKNGNGSRSPSPPADKKRESTQIKTDGAGAKVENNVPHEEKKWEVHVDKKVVETEKQPQEVNESKPQEDKEPVKKVLSEQEAATVIQSVYRGHDVRRWEPLKKLRQIAKIREEADEVRKRVEGIGSSIDEKEKVAVAETIMKLLLKLDTIQGLPPSFRDVRRSVAKELIMLQERLDSMISNKSTSVALETASSDEPKVVAEALEEPSKVCGQETTEETSKMSGLDEGSKVVVETTEEPLKISGGDEDSKVIVETTEEPKVDVETLEKPSKMSSSQDEGSKVVAETIEEPKVDVETLEEPSNICGEDEGSKVVEATEEPSRVSSEDEGLGSMVVVETLEETPKKNEGSEVAVETLEETPKKNEGSEVAVETLEETPKKNEGSEVAVETLEETPKKNEGSEVAVETLEETPKKIEGSEVAVETLEEPSKICTQDEGSEVVVETLEEPPQVFVETLEEPPKIFNQDKGSEVVVETIEEPSNDSTTELEGSKVIDTVEEVAEGSTKVASGEVESIEREDESVKICKGHDEMSKFNEDETGMAESEDQPARTDAAENTTEQPGMTVEHNNEQVTAPPPPKMPEKPDKSEISDMMEAANSGSTARKESETVDIEMHVSEPPEAAAADHKGPEQSEIPQIVTQESKHEEEPPHKEPKEELEQHEEKASDKEGQHEDEEEVSSELDRRIMEENEKLRNMLERLIASEKQQQELISSLSGKVKDLEQQLATKKKQKNSNSKVKSSFRRPRVVLSRAAAKPSNGGDRSLKGRSMSMGVAC